ncbi:ATP-dependent DNA ligase [Paenibacillus mucilaginosus]|uniref:ATP dependent DNA ligase n=1 Tax=Paenibacillus mucilaginosus (strain KNP414) TaxID=1036673 RepID=F8FRU4_PAEMK|nr:ATP-dependent DNA ligase [Paenibacillus mucilaginosus]AEI40651.1 ATP dependent DNA ligase [Paenibacillus mucilaginosus KNP414]MCG7211861.1 ATP-dependent DNA ligase [Paenibacillus mucilaginosus]WDM29790.1 ATP-dependent DNA ligase [Paenibacillus mucilaginosus]
MFISPMLLETAKHPFSNEHYLFEPKIDGHRLVLSRQGGQTRLYTRHHNDCTFQYPELNPVALDDVILDGEVAATDASGAIDFEAVMERFALRRADKVRRAAAERPVNYIVFDVLRYNGVDLRGLPLYRRKEILAGIDFGNPHMAKVPVVPKEGERLFEQIAARQLEGIVAKRMDSVYVGHRSEAWLKIINWQYAEVYLTGYKKEGFGWLAASAGPGGILKPAGLIELGITPKHRTAFNGVRDQLQTGEDGEFVYLEPKLKAKVKMRNWTRAGLLRSPVFMEFCR